MTLLQIAEPEEQSNVIQKVFASYTDSIGEVPRPLQMLSVSPELLMLQTRQISYFSNHAKLSFALLTCIRYLTAKHLDFAACIEFNKKLLLKQGMTADQIDALENDTVSAPLEETEIKLLNFVLKGLQHDIREEDIEKVYHYGWSDEDILDATSHCFSMIPIGKMMNLFRI